MSVKSVNVYRGVDGTIKQTPVELNVDLKPREILLRITHSGFCGTDRAFLPYGLALGHEGVGIVEKVGSEVTQFKVGDRAGGGYLRGSCGHCSYCLSGDEIMCYQRDIFGESNYNQGTFADYYVGTETYLHKIPDELSSEEAAPLQCAGATVYTALIRNLKPGMRVGIVGVGGLGHLAIQFASRLGAEVVVFSYTGSKEKEAKSLGAQEFYLIDEIDRLPEPVHLILFAGKGVPDLKKFFKKEVLARSGTLIPLSEPASTYDLPGFDTFFNSYNLASNLVASRKYHDDMLKFAATHSIKPIIEKFEMSEKGLNEVLEKLVSGKIRYRAVLCALGGLGKVD
ncbi:GroES-like protein [Patellaria atrata CBS 101060]|uniref:GroES-like protein n=1 Tax=Patellaria atrata CBS 101060 TaxID=1346257 RepID=A0A9P4SHT1_9PEZI|nr:GroES-like protein [Patellaria atrata CBS 101060]